MRLTLASLAALSLAACSGNAGNKAATAGNGANAAAAAPADNAANAAAPASNGSAAAERELRRETVTATFTSWEMGDYLWGNFTAPGREPFSAQMGPEPVALFLDANRGRQVTVEVATVMANIPENGGATEIQRIMSARNAAGTAEQWWTSMSAADQAAARRRFEEGPLSSGGR
jgi:hypothetical protein